MSTKQLKIVLGTILGLLLAIGFILGYVGHQANKSDLGIARHNLMVARDSIATLTLKNGEQVKTINSYILEKNQLEEYLAVSKKELKELEKKVGKTAYITNIETKFVHDTITVTDTVFVDTDTGDSLFSIKYNDEWFGLDGCTRIHNNLATTTFSSIYVPVPLQVGITNDYRIWVKSKNPYLDITSIEGAVITGSKFYQKPKRFGIGLQVGFGTQYDLVKERFGLGPYIGLGLSYNFLRF